VIVLSFGVLLPEQFGENVHLAFEYTTRYFSWFFALGTTFLMFFSLWAGFGKYGHIKLGGFDAKPDMSILSWVAITFTSGMALGVVFYGVGEPLLHFMQPPNFTNLAPGSANAAEAALKYVFVHWCLQPYGIYTASGLGFAFVYWNTKRPFELGSALYPLIGEKSTGWPGMLVNAMCLYVMVATLGTNVGLGTLQLTTGIDYVMNLKYSPMVMQLGVIVFLATIWIFAACTGIHKGIKYISIINVYIFVILLVWVFIFGDTIFILNNTISSIGKYLSVAVEQGLYLEPVKQTGWIGRQTIYYWAWWLTIAPLVGMFLVKLAKGRTIRQFVIVNMIVPIIFIFIWFGCFGSAAISAQLSGFDLWREIEVFGLSVSLFAFIQMLPLKSVMIILGFLAILFSFITQTEAMTYTMAAISSANKEETEDGEQKSPNFLKVFWGVSVAVMGFILIQSGGLDAVQTSVVICGLPILVLLIINAFAFIKSVQHRVVYDLTLTEKQKNEFLDEEKY